MSDSTASHGGASAQGGASKEPLHEALRTWRRNLLKLRDSLIQGDLPSARASFAALRGMDTSAAGTEVDVSTEVVNQGANAFVTLHRALQVGNLPAARQAFCHMMLALRSSPPKHRRHRRSERASRRVEAHPWPAAQPLIFRWRR